MEQRKSRCAGGLEGESHDAGAEPSRCCSFRVESFANAGLCFHHPLIGRIESTFFADLELAPSAVPDRERIEVRVGAFPYVFARPCVISPVSLPIGFALLLMSIAFPPLS